MTSSLTFEPTKRYPLRQWLVYEKLTRWSDSGDISIRISKSAKVFVSGINLEATDESQVEVLCLAIRGIEQAVRASGVQDPYFSDEDFGKSFGDVYRFCMAFQPELSIVYPQDELVPTFDKMICRTGIDLTIWRSIAFCREKSCLTNGGRGARLYCRATNDH